MKQFFVQHQLVFVNTRQTFVSTQNCFSCNTKLWTLFRFLCHGDIFLLLRSNKNIIECQKKNCLITFFVYRKFFIFNFYIAYWQHVDLLHSSPRNKETFNPSFTADIRKQLLSAALEKISSYYPGFFYSIYG